MPQFPLLILVVGGNGDRRGVSVDGGHQIAVGCLDIVGSGVETESQYQALKELGCRYQQGYYHQPPADLDQILANLGRPTGAFATAAATEPPPE